MMHELFSAPPELAVEISQIPANDGDKALKRGMLCCVADIAVSPRDVGLRNVSLFACSPPKSPK